MEAMVIPRNIRSNACSEMLRSLRSMKGPQKFNGWSLPEVYYDNL